MGQFYQYGIGTSVDLPKAVQWYQEAAQQGDRWAEEKLGWLFEHGTGVAKDREQAWPGTGSPRSTADIATVTSSDWAIRKR